MQIIDYIKNSHIILNWKAKEISQLLDDIDTKTCFSCTSIYILIRIQDYSMHMKICCIPHIKQAHNLKHSQLYVQGLT